MKVSDFKFSHSFSDLREMFEELIYKSIIAYK